MTTRTKTRTRTRTMVKDRKEVTLGDIWLKDKDDADANALATRRGKS